MAGAADPSTPHYASIVSGDASDVLDLWRERSATLGRRVRVDLGPDDVVGMAVDVTREGHLIVETLEGTRRTPLVWQTNCCQKRNLFGICMGLQRLRYGLVFRKWNTPVPVQLKQIAKLQLKVLDCP